MLRIVHRQRCSNRTHEISTSTRERVLISLRSGLVGSDRIRTSHPRPDRFPSTWQHDPYERRETVSGHRMDRRLAYLLRWNLGSRRRCVRGRISPRGQPENGHTNLQFLNDYHGVPGPSQAGRTCPRLYVCPSILSTTVGCVNNMSYLQYTRHGYTLKVNLNADHSFIFPPNCLI